MPDLFNSLRMALGFMTILPIPQRKEWSDLDFGWSALFYPLVGALIGAIAGAALYLFSKIFASPIASFLTLIVWILLSGGLHWDGLADSFDGFGSSASPERRLEIMKDSRLGTYGALGIICSLILKWLCIWHLQKTNLFILFALTGASSRWAMLYLLSKPLANPSGMAATLKHNCPVQICLYALPVPLLLAFLYGHFGILFLPAGFLSASLLGFIAEKKIGGINGDVLGFCIELVEIILLLAAQVIR